MEHIIDGFENLILKQTGEMSNELLLSELLFSIGNLSVHDHEFEWNRITDNYSKLIQLSKIISINESNLVYEPLYEFMKKIDKVNEYYLKNIDFDLNPCIIEFEHLEKDDMYSLIDTSMIIKESLMDSISINDPYQKLDEVIHSYKSIIELVEHLNGLKYVYTHDPDFERQFDVKRRKIH